MDSKQFREFGKSAVDFIADYMDTIRERDVLPSIEPGYLQNLIPAEAPAKGEPWQDLLADMERVIMPGITHWHSPSFHAYYPTGNTYPAIVGEMMTAGLGVIGFNWIASPACTELEVTMMNWLGKLIGLPEEFLNSSDGPGGGIIQGSASEATLIGLLAAKERMVRKMQAQNPALQDGEIKAKLVAYSSDQSNSSIEKAGLIGSMPMRLLPTDDDGQLRPETLQQAISSDRAQGLIPCYLVACLGTTGTCSFDPLDLLGPVCEREGVWMHVDAAYAGAAFVCPEYRHHLKGVEYAESYNFNPHKWMLVNFDCSALWVKNAQYLVEAFNVERIYLQHKHMGATPEYLHWQIPLGRKFRALKLWFVLRTYGVEGIQNHIRKQISLAKHFERKLRESQLFEINTSSMGLITFRVKNYDCEVAKKLLEILTAEKKIFMVPCTLKGKYLIRYVITSRFTEVFDVDADVEELVKRTKQLLMEKKMAACGDTLLGKADNLNIAQTTKINSSLEKSK